ncbi:uncharacterized protein LOC129410853 [Boleophthalmus pectinirostris]|uniref:uncharacterized protein LOC129410853 n=1 Tax=Boleophthalmus pectinirostris TaxID=150288 RepID=UPI00242A55D1|nr:uncharacterized protein LOC129410853 [Boleophthalmus pectinirostris]
MDEGWCRTDQIILCGTFGLALSIPAVFEVGGYRICVLLFCFPDAWDKFALTVLRPASSPALKALSLALSSLWMSPVNHGFLLPFHKHFPVCCAKATKQRRPPLATLLPPSEPGKIALERFIEESKKINNGPPARYQLQLKRVNLDKESNEESKLRRFTLGERDPKHLNKTILLVGATGSGKSTLINTLVNFVMGVKFEDKVWFEVITDEKNKPQSESQTTAVSVYDIYGFEGKTVPYSLTIIDTPGYGDTRGLEHDDMVTKKLKDLFCISEGV